MTLFRRVLCLSKIEDTIKGKQIQMGIQNGEKHLFFYFITLFYSRNLHQ